MENLCGEHVPVMESRQLPLKTDDPRYERNDFVQTEFGTVKELTVTITLAEYRSLVKDLGYWQAKALAADRETAALRHHLSEATKCPT